MFCVQFGHHEDAEDRMVGSFERNWHEIESVYEAVEGVSKKGDLCGKLFLILDVF